MIAKPLPSDDLHWVIENARESLLCLQGKSIFITGGTGFLGRWIVETLVHANDQLNLNLSLSVFSRDPEKFLRNNPHLESRKGLDFVQGDVRDLPSLDQAFSIVIHGATDSAKSLANNQFSEVQADIVAGTESMIKFAESCGCERFLYLSSGAVYGKNAGEKVFYREEDPLLAEPGYGQGKAMAEKLAETTPSFDFLIARLFAFLGPNMPMESHFAAGNFISNLLNEENINIQGDGSPLRSYLYPADTVVWLLKILKDGKSRRPYNVGSDQPVSILELADTVSSLSDKTSVSTGLPPTNGVPLSYVPSIERSKKELDLKVFTDLQTSIKKTINWNANENFSRRH